MLTFAAGGAAAEPLLDTDSDVLLQAAEDAAWGEANWFEVPGMSLDVRTGHAQSELGSETYVMAALNLPLERLGAANLRSPTASAIERDGARRSTPLPEPATLRQPTPRALPSDAAADAAPQRDRAAPELPPEAPEQAPPASSRGVPQPARAARASSGAPPAERARAHALELPGELVDEALRRAERSAGVTGIEARIGSLARRARTSGLVPELRVRGMHGVDQSTSLDSTGAYPGDSTVKDGLDALVEVRLTFELDRLVFGSEEPGLVKQLAEAQKQRDELEETVTDLLLDWFEAHERLTLQERREAPSAAGPGAEATSAEAPGEQVARERAGWSEPRDESLEDGLDADERARQRAKDRSTLRRSEAHLRRLTGGWFRGAATLAHFAGALR